MLPRVMNFMRGDRVNKKYNSPCWGCAVGEYCDYSPQWCRDSAVKKIAADELHEPHDCANWRQSSVMVGQMKTA